MKTISMAFALFLLMDPIGNIPLFIAILKGISPKRQQQIIIRELLIALSVMILFNYVGDILLTALQVTEYSVLLSGGIILFLLSLKMIFPSKTESEMPISADKEPFVVPLAVPLVAGPAVLAAIILYSRQETSQIATIFAIVSAWAVSTIILLSSTLLNRLLGQKGILACERLMGLILTMVSIQMFLEGLTLYLKGIPT